MSSTEVIAPEFSSVPEAPHPRLWSAARALCRLATTMLFGLKTYGLGNVPRSGGVLLISNHQSYLDPVLLATHLPRPLSFMAKAELFENPRFSSLIRTFNAFPVRRGEADVAAIKESLRRLKEGKVLALFPEGTRTRRGEINPIQPGIAMLIRRAQVPVVPTVIHGAIDAWPRRAKVFHPHPIRVTYGPPLLLHDLKGNQIVPRLQCTLEKMMQEVRDV